MTIQLVSYTSTSLKFSCFSDILCHLRANQTENMKVNQTQNTLRTCRRLKLWVGLKTMTPVTTSYFQQYSKSLPTCILIV
jgi:hypothetical protein